MNKTLALIVLAVALIGGVTVVATRGPTPAQACENGTGCQ